jgi:hypothetical protein
MCLSMEHWQVLDKQQTCVYIYINKDGNPFTKSTRHVNANVTHERKTKTIKIVVMKWKT